MDNEKLQENESLPEEKPICTNCGKKMARKGKFCPHCGQKKFEGSEPVGELLSRFARKAFHLDNKALLTLRQLFIPAGLSREYFQGRIKSYTHPLRLFFVVMFFFLLAINISSNADQGAGNLEKTRAINIKFQSSIDTSATYDAYEVLSRYVQAREINAIYDSLPDSMQTSAVRSAYKRLVEERFMAFYPESIGTNDSSVHVLGNPIIPFLDTLPLNFFHRKVSIASRDIVHLTPEEIMTRYKITYFWDKILVKQGIKTLKDPKGLARAYLGSLTWTILALVALMAWMAKILFWRSRKYYVEHFIFLLHVHTAILLVLTLLLALDVAGWPLLSSVQGGIVLGLLGFVTVSFKWYYRQRWVAVVFKTLIFNLIYVLVFILMFLLGLVMVFAVF